MPEAHRSGGPPVPKSEAEALASVEGAEPVGLPTPRGVVRSLLSVVAQPGPLAQEAAQLSRDTLRVVRGSHEITPSPKDKRFADPAWATNPVYRRLAQEYLILGRAMTRLVDEFEASGADWREVEQARFIINAVTSALAPTNSLIGNPAALKRAIESGGRSLARGLGHWLSDVRHDEQHAFPGGSKRIHVGADLGVAPGAVVHRTEVVEVIQYASSDSNRPSASTPW